MKLKQTTLFGMRGERIRIKKSSPLAVQGRGSGVVTDLSLAPARKKRGTPDARGGKDARSGATLLDLALWLAAGCLAMAVAMRLIFGRGGYERVAWVAEYPDPTCERCGKVLDGINKDCEEEVR